MTSSCKKAKVATTVAKERWSRHQLPQKGSRDIIQLSRQQLWKRRSRQHLVVATSIAKTRGRDVIKQSRQQKQGKEVTTPSRSRDSHYREKEVATTFSGRDIKCTQLRSRHQLHQRHITTKQRLLRQRQRQKKVMTRSSCRDINNQLVQLTAVQKRGASKLGPNFRTL